MKFIGILLFGFFLFQTSHAQRNMQGVWEGKLSVAANTLRLVIHLTKQDSAYAATLDSPDQGARGIPVSSVRVAGDSLYLEVKAAQAKLTGRLTSDSTFEGQWQQGGASLPIGMKKAPGSALAVAQKRPQTPVPPFSYDSKDVIYHNADRSIQFGATITKPFGSGPFPAVLLITGSGPQNRDEELFGHKPFAVIADDLTKRGFLVLRADDRGVGQSTGDRAMATSKDFANDAMAHWPTCDPYPKWTKPKSACLGTVKGE